MPFLILFGAAMKRREFMTLVGGAVAGAWMFPASAQQPERVRRVGNLMNVAADNTVGPARVAVFSQGLRELGWIDGQNIRIDHRWAANDSELYRTLETCRALARMSAPEGRTDLPGGQTDFWV